MRSSLSRGARLAVDHLLDLGHRAIALVGGPEGNADAAERLAAMARRPTAVFAANDAMAIGCLAGLRACGLEVPGDLSLVGFDDVPNARYLTPALTTVRVPIAEVGGRATERLLRMLSDPAEGDEEDEV